MQPALNGEVLFCADHVELRREGDRTVLVDRPAGGFALNELGAAIAERLNAPTTLATVCEGIVASFDIEPVECAARVEQFVDDLRGRDRKSVV